MYVLSQSTSSLPSIQSHHPVLLHRSMLHVRPFHNLPNPPGHPAEICDGKIRPSLVRRRREIHFYHPPGMARNFGDGRIIFLPDRVCKKTSPEDDESCHDMSVMILVVYIVFYYNFHLRKGGASCHPEKTLSKHTAFRCGQLVIAFDCLSFNSFIQMHCPASTLLELLRHPVRHVSLPSSREDPP